MMMCQRPSCRRAAVADDRCDRHQRSPADYARRTVRLTDKGRAAVGAPVMVDVPLLDLPWREDTERGAA